MLHDNVIVDLVAWTVVTQQWTLVVYSVPWFAGHCNCVEQSAQEGRIPKHQSVNVHVRKAFFCFRTAVSFDHFLKPE